MANYLDFVRQHANGQRIRRLYWVYGEEDVLKNAVVQRLRDLVDAGQYNSHVLSASDMDEPEVWANINQHPIDPTQKKFVVVHRAEKLKSLNEAVLWLKDGHTVRSGTTVVFVSDDSTWENEERETIAKSSSASHVKCTLPKDMEDRLKRTQEILTAWGDIDRISAGVLAKRVNFDLVEARAVMFKTSLFPGAQVTPSIIEKLAPRRVEEDVVKAILALNRKSAVEALVEGSHEVSPVQIIGALAAHLELLTTINSVLGPNVGPREAAQRIGAKEQHVRHLYPYARLYPRKEAVRRMELLARLDAAAQHGAKEGVLEALIALW